jgi:hypothetical protein
MIWGTDTKWGRRTIVERISTSMSSRVKSNKSKRVIALCKRKIMKNYRLLLGLRTAGF